MTNSDKTKVLMDEYIAETKKSKHILAGQVGLETVLRTGKYSVYGLPAPYTLIFDSMKAQGPPVIEHFQASRRARRR